MNLWAYPIDLVIRIRSVCMNLCAYPIDLVIRIPSVFMNLWAYRIDLVMRIPSGFMKTYELIALILVMRISSVFYDFLGSLHKIK